MPYRLVLSLGFINYTAPCPITTRFPLVCVCFHQHSTAKLDDVASFGFKMWSSVVWGSMFSNLEGKKISVRFRVRDSSLGTRVPVSDSGMGNDLWVMIGTKSQETQESPERCANLRYSSDSHLATLKPQAQTLSLGLSGSVSF